VVVRTPEPTRYLQWINASRGAACAAPERSNSFRKSGAGFWMATWCRPT